MCGLQFEKPTHIHTHTVYIKDRETKVLKQLMGCPESRTVHGFILFAETKPR